MCTKDFSALQFSKKLSPQRNILEKMVKFKLNNIVQNNDVNQFLVYMQ